jgi:predicted acetyltransferase
MKLVQLSYEYKDLLIDMIEEWEEFNKTHETDHSPWIIFKNDCHNFDLYLSDILAQETLISDKYVPSSTYFLLDEENNKFIGALNLRHYLNDKLLFDGGHIGDGIRPSERKKGYATLMIKLALSIAKELGIKKVLMVCNKDNIGSKKSIIHNGGVLENEIIDEDGNIWQRYWITL